MTTKYFICQAFFCLFFGVFNQLNAQEEPFNCDYNAYLFQRNDVYALDLASGSSYEVATDITDGNINATGYNPAGGFIWGSLSSPSKTIVKIGRNFQVTTYYIPELPENNRYVGDVSQDGVYYLKPGGQTYYTIDLDPESPTYTQYLGSGSLSENLNVHDWAFNAVDGQLYTVEKATNRLLRINATTGIVTNLGEVPILSGYNYTYGAVYFDASGRFYVSANQTGTVFIIYNVQDLAQGSTMVSNLFAYGPSSSSNDGARCPTAPVPQEDCLNGIDDDGDGLVDCEDPSCSGVSSCPIIEPTSGGNEGGLESNNRLSQKINRRNYQRAKNNYSFGKEQANIIEKGSNYGKRTRNSGFDLVDFVPQNIIQGATAIESTPQDLLAITNATEILTVDYDKGGETVAAMMILKTENGVYEHTKYICDRLLGAELVSVSTLELNGQEFIKSIIRNPEGQLEFVLSLSGRLVNEASNFLVESHWNLDRYTADKTFYNFQIWTNSLDDLLNLSNEVLRLMDVQSPIESYILSKPPPVFVKKGAYVNGQLELEIVNSNYSSALLLEGGVSTTETSGSNTISAQIELESTYVTTYVVETGSIFDIGFRLTNESGDTPDDLFMSDGPWGADDYATGTNVNSFEVSSNETAYEGSGFRVERNISLQASTSEYVSVYRAFTPKFQAVDLTGFNSLEFEAAGTGALEITIVKKNIERWEDQFRTTIQLSDEQEYFVLSYDQFKSNAFSKLDLDNATSIVFSMVSEDQTMVTKTLDLSNLTFSYSSQIANFSGDKDQVTLAPNPINESTAFQFFMEDKSTVTLVVYDLLGKVVYQSNLDVRQGFNTIPFENSSLKTGVYLYQLTGTKLNSSVGRLMVR